MDFEEMVIGSIEELNRLAIKFESTVENREDLVQDTIIKALLNKDKFEIGTNFNGWIFTIMRNTFLTKNRKKKKRIIPIQFVYDYEVKYEPHIIDKDILKEFNKLPYNIKTAMILFDAGYKYREISKIMNRPKNTISSDILKGRRLMQKKINNL